MNWTGAAGDNNWDTAANWDIGSAIATSPPGTGDDVQINSGTVNLSHAATVNSLTVSGGTLGGTGDVTVSGLFTWNGGAVSGPAGSSLRAEGGLAISGSCTLDTRSLVNDAAATLTGTLSIRGGPAITNSAGATFDLHGTASAVAIGSVQGAVPGDFYNAGTLTSESAGDNVIGVALHNSGTVALHTGDLDLIGSDAAGPTSSGAITGDPGTALQFDLFGSPAATAVADDFTPGSSIAGDVVGFDEGSYLVEGGYHANATFTANGASVTFAAAAPAPQVGPLTMNPQASREG
jgi:hypothetical protein